MALDEWTGPEHTLAKVMPLLHAPLSETLPRLSAVASDVVAHDALLMLTGDCVASPLKSCGDPELTARASVSEMTRLAGIVRIGHPWFGSMVFAGTPHPVLAVTSSPAGSAGTLLVAVLGEDRAPDPAQRGVMQLLWDMATAHILTLNAKVEPAYLSQSRAVSNERARAVAELTDAHAATLTTLLAALRSRDLTDAAARRTATDLAASALVELRTAGEHERSQGEETVDEAFAHLSDKLVLLMRYKDASLELSPPERPGHPLPAGVADAARAAVRGAVLTMLDQPDVTRIRVAWDVDGGALHISVRDDGPGTLTTEAFGIRRLATGLVASNADLRLDPVPGWGTTIAARLPLASPEAPDAAPPSTLNPRELDVLHQLTLGRRNRQIAQQLHISEHTVKYHVANILDKLGVGSRGEAAAAARDFGLVSTTRDSAS